jgi:plasmid stabilization system protein ParE
MENSCGENAAANEPLPLARRIGVLAVHRVHLCIKNNQEETMPRGDKSKYTEKEKRQAEHIEEGYEKRGIPENEAERRAWATVNKVHGGGEKPGGGGYGKPENHEPMRKGGRTSHSGGAH